MAYIKEGARRVWRQQRILWWMLAVNLVLAAFGTGPMVSRVGQVADHSLHSQALVNGFDVAAFVELASNPDVAFWSKMSDTLWPAIAFFVFSLFMTGGILESYRSDRKLPAADFFRACGAYFWRWVRLLVLLLIVLTPIFFLTSGITKWSGTLSQDSPHEKLGFWVDVYGLLFVALLMMIVRLCFDMAQVRTIAEEEWAVRRSLGRALKQTFRNFGSLFWMYFRISFVAWLGLAAAFWFWLHIPAARIGSTFLLCEVLLAWWQGTRLWQRASETVWYERHPEAAIYSTVPPVANPTELIRPDVAEPLPAGE
jgi:TRAP-type C4-dicarboxylate transport system permease small subunit